MTREIKFRAWEENSKSWIEDFSVRADGTVDSPDARITGLVSITQFMGLKDRNGKDIYEGDILESLDGRKSEIVFEDGCFFLKHIGLDDSDFIAPRNHFEILGNIYENPDLLHPSNKK